MRRRPLEPYNLVMGDYTISTDNSRLQPKVIWNFLHHHAEWARGIPFTVMCRTLEHSLNFGLYTHDTTQIGFARVITDYGQFAYLCDVFVLVPYRGQGLGKALVHAVMAHPDLRGLRRYALDAAPKAATLYASFGFSPLSDPSGHLEITHQPEDIWREIPQGH